MSSEEISLVESTSETYTASVGVGVCSARVLVVACKLLVEVVGEKEVGEGEEEEEEEEEEVGEGKSVGT